MTAAEQPPPPDPRWPLALRWAFRFCCAWFALYAFPWPLSLLPGTGQAVNFYADHWNAGISWAAAHLLHLEGPISEASNGSGDRLFSWVEMGCYLALAALAAVVWSALDRKRPHYQELNGWLRILVRYQLAGIMIGYGLAKMIKNQFPFPFPIRLEEKVGDLSPMGLLWTFMGYSTPYTFFAGAGEVAGAVLLYFRRTTTLGALILAAMLANVVALNFSYDVPVKLYSSYLLLLAIFLLVPDLGRLGRVLVLNQPAPPADLRPPYRARGLVALGYLLKAGLAAMAIYQSASMNLEAHESPSKPAAGLSGAWKVEEFVRAGVTVPPLAGDASRWRMVFVTEVAWGRFLTVQGMDDAKTPYGLTVERKDAGPTGTLELTPRNDPKAPKLRLAFTRPDPEHLIVEGDLQGPVRLRLQRIDPAGYLLVNRGFHWVNEVPFNR